MGYERHDQVIVHFSEHDEYCAQFWRDISILRRALDALDGLTGDIIGTFEGINGHNTAIFYPDGSKKGWNASTEYGHFRNKFLEKAKKLEYGEIIVISGCLDHNGIEVEFINDEGTFKKELGDF